VSLFRRRAPLHQRLAAAGGLGSDALTDGAPSAGASRLAQPADPPGWHGEERGEPGIHGVARARRWGAVVTADAPDVRGDVVHFVALPDGSLVVEEDEPDGGLTPLADAVETSVPPPYRAEAVRREGSSFTVGASSVSIVEIRSLSGDEAELSTTRDGSVLRVDGRTVLGRAPELERIGEGAGTEYVVRASRVDDHLWEVDATAL
jgi:hypothetical protein